MKFVLYFFIGCTFRIPQILTSDFNIDQIDIFSRKKEKAVQNYVEKNLFWQAASISSKRNLIRL